jgi:hypothetical protein
VDCILLVIHGLHSGIGFSFLRIADKAEASTAASVAVLDDNLLWGKSVCGGDYQAVSHSQLLRLDRTLQTLHARFDRRCARQGLCNVSTT